MLEKKELRLLIRKKLLQKSKLWIQKQSFIIQKKIVQLQQFQTAKTIFVYLATDREVQTDWLLKKAQEDEKIILVPKIITRSMQAIQIDTSSQFKKNQFGILEPSSNEIWTKSIDFCLTPGLVFDKKLNRLGRGGANYDQFIKAHPHTYYLGVCFTCQIFPTLAIEKHDQKVDALISETLCFP